jgi:hypothetical protein
VFQSPIKRGKVSDLNLSDAWQRRNPRFNPLSRRVRPVI